MTVYTVMVPPGDKAADPMRFQFVKEGFAWPALFFPGLWLIFRRLWLVLVLYLVVAGVLGGLDDRFGGPLPGLLMLLAHFLFALEANGLRRWTLLRHGWRLADVIEAPNLGEAERRYYAAWETPVAAGPATPAVPPAPPPAPHTPSAEAGDVVGLFPAPGGAR